MDTGTLWTNYNPPSDKSAGKVLVPNIQAVSTAVGAAQVCVLHITVGHVIVVRDLVYQTQIQRVVAGAVALWVTRLFLGREIQNLTPTGSVSCILGQDTLLSQ